MLIGLAVFGVSLSHMSVMSVWRDNQEQSEHLEGQRRWQGVRVLGLDGAYPPLGWGKKRPMLIAVDPGNGVSVVMGQVDESNPQAARRFLEPLVQRLGVSVIVTDDLVSFRTVANQLGLEQQICQFHLRRWVSNALRELQEIVAQEWQWVLEEIRCLLAELPPDGSRRLFELWKQIPERRIGQAGARSPMEQLRHRLIRLSKHWDSYRVFDWQPEVPWTNNGTERVNGRMKMRSRTVRGYKSWQGMKAAPMLTGSGLNW